MAPIRSALPIPTATDPCYAQTRRLVYEEIMRILWAETLALIPVYPGLPKRHEESPQGDELKAYAYVVVQRTREIERCGWCRARSPRKLCGLCRIPAPSA